MAEKFLDKAYGLNTNDAVKDHYDDWSASYDDEIGENGYQTPARLARLLAAVVTDINAPLLDFGCGTGVSGEALTTAGFSRLDGVDISPGMLRVARAKEIYRNLTQLDPAVPLPVGFGKYQTISAIGVVSTGGAPPETLDTLLNTLAPGGLLAFSYNDHTLEDVGYMDRLAYWQDGDRTREVVREYGPHLPGINLNSMIYVLEKT
ncbi:MAG: methyltransferase domain-containing protein [Rhodobacteraceae bacterium]|nr:methyltransferase domain-containing protein [Paracoccaceae bacterium]